MDSIPSPKLKAFRDCFEAGMDYETAIGCAGLPDVAALRAAWTRWERKFNS